MSYENLDKSWIVLLNRATMASSSPLVTRQSLVDTGGLGEVLKYWVKVGNYPNLILFHLSQFSPMERVFFFFLFK